MTKQHPITPPPELVEKWRAAPEYTTGREKLMMVSMTTQRLQEIATQSARWGADQELEACEKYWIIHAINPEGVVRMREHRRPKPPSLAEQALDDLNTIQTHDRGGYQVADLSTIRAALKRLQELEKDNE